MLTLNQLTAIAEVDRVDVKTVERDYVLTHLLQRLSSLEASESLTFKGGTALRTVHLQTFRYSADIDLNVNTNGFTDRRLGHSSIAVTLDRYSHMIDGMDREAAETVAALIR